MADDRDVRERRREHAHAAERRELTSAQEVLVRILGDAILEDVIEEKTTADAPAEGASTETEREPEHAEAACR
jgi:hypothetical protein